MNECETPLILIIEDDQTLRDLACDAFVDSGKYRVVSERFLATGIRQARNLKPACVVLDLTLPDCNGLNALRHFLNALPAKTVAVVTGDDAVIGPTCILAGAMDYIEKPFAGPELVKRVDLAIARAEVRPYHQPVNDQFEAVLKTLEQKKQHDSRCPDDGPGTPTAPTVARGGHSTIRMLAAIVLLFASFQLGGELRGRAMRADAALPVAAVAVGTPATAHGQFDSKLAELRARPNIPAIDYFMRQPVDESRRAEVAAALEWIVTHGDIDRARVAVRALGKWGTVGNRPAMERFAEKEKGAYKTWAETALAKIH